MDRRTHLEKYWPSHTSQVYCYLERNEPCEIITSELQLRSFQRQTSRGQRRRLRVGEAKEMRIQWADQWLWHQGNDCHAISPAPFIKQLYCRQVFRVSDSTKTAYKMRWEYIFYNLHRILRRPQKLKQLRTTVWRIKESCKAFDPLSMGKWVLAPLPLNLNWTRAAFTTGTLRTMGL